MRHAVQIERHALSYLAAAQPPFDRIVGRQRASAITTQPPEVALLHVVGALSYVNAAQPTVDRTRPPCQCGSGLRGGKGSVRASRSRRERTRMERPMTFDRPRLKALSDVLQGELR